MSSGGSCLTGCSGGRSEEELISKNVFPARSLYAYNGGFFRNRHLRRILALAGHPVRFGFPGRGDGVVVWGRSPYAYRGERVARHFNVPLVRVEDAFLRSVLPGLAETKSAPLGLMIDPDGVYFDPSRPSRLELILSNHLLDSPTLLSRARLGIERLRHSDLSKYNIHKGASPLPKPGYVLLIDQAVGDASLRYGGGRDPRVFQRMLCAALEENPGCEIVIKTHPEVAMGFRKGHFDMCSMDGRVVFFPEPASPWALLESASSVYTVSSQMGFEAILAGHRPHVFGLPFYVGWGLSHDRIPLERRKRILSKEQLFAGAMLLAPTWYNPCLDRLCSFEEALDHLEAEVRAFREDRKGYIAVGMRLWKRRWLQAMFGRYKTLRFIRDIPRAASVAHKAGSDILVWGVKNEDEIIKYNNNIKAFPNLPITYKIEDGFLRSRGLGAALVPSLSCVRDDLGIYCDPHKESRLERLILSPLPPGGEKRAQRLREKLVTLGISKYNLEGTRFSLPTGFRILVPGQVEDDASILRGTSTALRRNIDLLTITRDQNPDSVIIYKPHPDVEAGLRKGTIESNRLDSLADIVAVQADPIALMEHCDAVWTLTSLMGFEALLRGKAVTCLGTPFYAGWGLTNDLGSVPERRLRDSLGLSLPRPTLDHLVYATLIAYPRYYDPVSQRSCSVETVIERLSVDGDTRNWRPSRLNSLIAKAQGYLAKYAFLWRC